MADAAEAMVIAAEIALAIEREKTRDMNEGLRALQAVVDSKDMERLMLQINKDLMLAETEAGDDLVANFLEAVDQGNLDDNAAKEALRAFGFVDENNVGGVEAEVQLDDEGTGQ